MVWHPGANPTFVKPESQSKPGQPSLLTSRAVATEPSQHRSRSASLICNYGLPTAADPYFTGVFWNSGGGASACIAAVRTPLGFGSITTMFPVEFNIKLESFHSRSFVQTAGGAYNAILAANVWKNPVKGVWTVSAGMQRREWPCLPTILNTRCMCWSWVLPRRENSIPSRAWARCIHQASMADVGKPR